MAHQMTRYGILVALATFLAAGTTQALSAGYGTVTISLRGPVAVAHYAVANADDALYARAEVTCDVTIPSGQTLHLTSRAAVRGQRVYFTNFRFTAWRHGHYVVRCAWRIRGEDGQMGEYAVAGTEFDR